ncbi:MAG: efflux RND transporter periplasmic adaptor subunit [Lachnospiraceae bacterium]|nr:efflux RND transporter periplasmic adaptor subunit [Lachnospiraceae bacterium]
MKTRQRKIALLVCTVLSASTLWGCGNVTVEETADDVAIVETASPEVGELKLSANYIATINPDESVYVIPKTTAEVLEVFVEAGDVVAEGDVLAILDDTAAQFTMRNAEAAVRNAQIGLENAQLGLASAQLGYDMQYGEAATILNDMNSDVTLTQVEDGMTQLQEAYVDAMDARQRALDSLRDEEEELADLKKEYNFEEDVDEIRKRAENLSKTPDISELGVGIEMIEKMDASTLLSFSDYGREMAKYQEAAQKVATVEAKIAQYKAAIDQCEETIENVQDQMNSTYENYSRTVTSQNLSNGVLREEQKQTSQNSISQAELGISQAEAGISQAQISIDQAQENLEAYTITAVISGVVESVNIKEHDFAASSNPAFIISNKDTMVATYYVSEDVRNTFSTGQKITLEKDDKLYDGEVIEIGSALDAATGLFRIKAAVRGDTANLLSGTKATVTTDTYHEKNAIIIPYDSVYYDGTQAYVYTVVDGKAKKTEVTTGLYDIDRIVITEGLTKDDTIITTWSAQLRDGVEVSARENNVNTENSTQE